MRTPANSSIQSGLRNSREAVASLDPNLGASENLDTNPLRNRIKLLHLEARIVSRSFHANATSQSPLGVCFTVSVAKSSDSAVTFNPVKTVKYSQLPNRTVESRSFRFNLQRKINVSRPDVNTNREKYLCKSVDDCGKSA